MRRREFVALISGAAVISSIAAWAQQSERPRLIGALIPSRDDRDPLPQAYASAFLQRLRELGWIEVRTFSVEYRWSEPRPERYAEIAAEFVRLNVDVIVTLGSVAQSVKQVTSDIPIVFMVGIDPVGSGLVASLAKPGGNVTGLSVQASELAGKRIEILREIVPQLRRLGILFDGGSHQAVVEVGEIQAAAHRLDLETAPVEIRRAEDIGSAFQGLNGRADALYAVVESLIAFNRVRILTTALSEKLPMIFGDQDFVRAGALVSYGPNYLDLFRHSADLVDRILRGAKPGDIPVEQPTKFELAINLTTAKALGLTLPPSLLARADLVVE